MLDSDLAALYGLDMAHFNKAVTRNEKRFSEQLRFQLTERELDNLKSKILISNWNRRRALPFVFTEAGACSIPSVVRNPNAVQVGRAIMEAFIGLRNAQSERLQPEDTVADHFADASKMFPASQGTSEPVRGDGQVIQDKIYEIRGQRVMLDRDLSELYQVTTSALNQVVKRNAKRFPTDFMFRLTDAETENWKSQIVITNSVKMGLRQNPYAFTEQGVAMLSGLLNSDVAIQANIVIMRAFVSMRNYLSRQSALSELTDFLRKQLLALSRNQAAMAARLRQLEIEREQSSCKAPADMAPKRTPSKFLSDNTCVGVYSERALIVYNNEKSDCRLLKSIGARFNPYLTWQGERMAGWILPKKRKDDLLGLLPEQLRNKVMQFD
ncbi:MAG: ORF6N domain-containing protein [Lachnospiraceae bacterium]|nr:ORF6N domain-containing protein [Lachnospiraceae bacterium]